MACWLRAFAAQSRGPESGSQRPTYRAEHGFQHACKDGAVEYVDRIVGT